MQHIPKQKSRGAIAKTASRQIGELLVPGISNGAVNVAQVRLVRSGHDPACESCRRRDHCIIFGDVELLDQKRAREKKSSVVFLDKWQSVDWRCMEINVRKILGFDFLVEKIEDRIDIRGFKSAAQVCKDSLATSEVWTPIVNQGDRESL